MTQLIFKQGNYLIEPNLIIRPLLKAKFSPVGIRRANRDLKYMDDNIKKKNCTMK